MGAEAVLQEHGVARRQRARRIFGIDFQHEQARPFGRAMQRSAQGLDPRRIRRHAGLGKAAGRSHRGEIEPAAGMAPLHAGLAEMPVVDHGDRQIFRPRHRDGREAAQAHQLLAVAGDCQNIAVRPGLGEPEADQRRAAHGAPEVKIRIAVARGVDVVGRRSEPGHHQELAAILEQGGNRRAPVESHAAPHQIFLPSMRWEISTAICWSAS